MTTMVFDGALLAVDQRVTCGSMIIMDDHKKLFHKPGVGAVAVGGDTVIAEKVAQWVFNGAQPHQLPQGTWNCLFVDTEGKCGYADEKGGVLEVAAPHCGGSGREIAMGAVAAGSSAMKALKIAIELDVYTGGGISTYNWESDHAIHAVVMRI